MEAGARSVIDCVSAMSPTERIERLRQLEFELRTVEAELGVLAHAIGNDRLFREEGHLTIGGFLRGDLRWSKQQVTERLRLGRAAAAFPDVAEHLAAGCIGVDQARLLARAATHPRAGDQFPDHADLLLEHARVLTHQQFNIDMQSWLAQADADGANQEAEAGHENRAVSASFHDGVGRLYARCGALDYAEFSRIFDQYRRAEFLTDLDEARARYGDGAADGVLARTDAQRAWDALLQMARDAVSTPPGSQPPEPVVHITFDITTFEAQATANGLIPAAGRSPEPELPDLPFARRGCHANGIPISPDEALQAAIHGRIRRVVFDSAGVIVDYGRSRRLFEGALRDAVMQYSPTCVFPGCGRPAAWCDGRPHHTMGRRRHHQHRERRPDVPEAQPDAQPGLHGLARPERDVPHVSPRRPRDRPAATTPRWQPTRRRRHELKQLRAWVATNLCRPVDPNQRAASSEGTGRRR